MAEPDGRRVQAVGAAGENGGGGKTLPGFEIDMTAHGDHRFSITVHSDDLAVVNCARALLKFSEKTGNNQIPWGGTKETDWQRADHPVTLRFSSEKYRQGFLTEMERLLPKHLWRIAATSN